MTAPAPTVHIVGPDVEVCQGCSISFVVEEEDQVLDDGAIFCRHCWMEADTYAADLLEEDS